MHAVGLMFVAILLMVSFSFAIEEVGIVQVAEAHHLEVATATSDVDAFGVYLSEWYVQHVELDELYARYGQATSGEEKSDLVLELQNGLVVTIAHLEALDIRPCFRPFAVLVLEELETFARYFEVVADSPPLGTVLMSNKGNLIQAIGGQVAPTLLGCTGATT